MFILSYSTNAETSGPLDEIDFWKARSEDLVGIQQQLEGPINIYILYIIYTHY